MPLCVCADYALSIAQWLHRLGYIARLPERITPEQIRVREKFLFRMLHSFLPMPTSCDWIAVFFNRLEILTRNRYATQLTHARYRCDVLVRMCTLMLDTSDPYFPPRRIARGLLVHSLVAMRLLPLQLLQPSSMDFTFWQILFTAGQPEGSRAALSCVLENDSLLCLLSKFKLLSDQISPCLGRTAFTWLSSCGTHFI